MTARDSVATSKGGGSSSFNLRSWTAVIAVATIVGLAESLKAVYMMRLQGVPWTLGQGLIGNLPWWYAWAVLTPGIFWFAGAVRLDDDGGRTRAFVIHALASVLVAAAHVLTVGSLYYYTVILQNEPAIFGRATSLPGVLQQWAGTFGIFEILTYWAIIAAYYTTDLYRRHRDSSVLSARLQARAASLQLHSVEAQVRALRMELNPHFLYNTLNTIGALIRKGQNADAVQMVVRLGDLLRATLDRELGPEMTLKSELVLLQQYLDIERIRFGDRLTVEVDVPPETSVAMVPTLMLQPLVENAVRHGIGTCTGPGTIRISARRDGDRLRLSVRDTGLGLGHNAAGNGQGIGLSNTRARLEQLHGTAGTLELSNAEEGGAVVTVTLPYQVSQETINGDGPVDRSQRTTAGHSG